MSTAPTETNLESDPDLPLNLRRGRRPLDGHPEITTLGPWVWSPHVARWTLHTRLSPAGIPPGAPLKTTDWYVLAEALYPWGAITCQPSADGGLVVTYPHQRHNARGDPELPWRSGLLCLNTEHHILGRHGYDDEDDKEPYTASERLRWHLERALRWLEAAERSQLLAPGDPYELPDFPGATAGGRRLGFAESADTFAVWRTVPRREGLLDLRPIHSTPSHLSPRRRGSTCTDGDVRIAARFCDIHRLALVTPPWGHIINASHVNVEWGAWIRLDACPLLPPWQAPTTWGDLRRACQSQGIDVDPSLRRVVPHLRDGQRHVLLLGFPIPERIGELPCRMHWAGILLPVLSNGTYTAKGFRPQEPGYWQRDRRLILADEAPLEWLAGENWDSDYLTTRGRMSPALTRRRVLIIGAGALGSAVAELLARGGVTDFVIADGERLEAGNLVRHTLTLGEVGSHKAVALAMRLSQISPYVTARPLARPFPPERLTARGTELDPRGLSDSEAVGDTARTCDLVIDCTGDDTTLARLATTSWEDSPCFVSLSVGYYARRLWCFVARGEHFPHAAFQALIAPWLEREQAEYAQVAQNGNGGFPREGIGCWHPVFPARADDIWLLASAAVKRLETLVEALATGAAHGVGSLTVFEQDTSAARSAGGASGAGFSGLRIAAYEEC